MNTQLLLSTSTSSHESTGCVSILWDPVGVCFCCHYTFVFICWFFFFPSSLCHLYLWVHMTWFRVWGRVIKAECEKAPVPYKWHSSHHFRCVTHWPNICTGTVRTKDVLICSQRSSLSLSHQCSGPTIVWVLLDIVLSSLSATTMLLILIPLAANRDESQDCAVVQGNIFLIPETAQDSFVHVKSEEPTSCIQRKGRHCSLIIKAQCSTFHCTFSVTCKKGWSLSQSVRSCTRLSFLPLKN